MTPSLSDDLRPAEHDRVGPLGATGEALEHVELLLRSADRRRSAAPRRARKHSPACGARRRSRQRRRHRRSAASLRGEVLAVAVVLRRLARVESQVLEQRDVAVRKVVDGVLR